MNNRVATTTSMARRTRRRDTATCSCQCVRTFASGQRARGMRVVGVDNDPAVSPDVLADMRDLSKLPRDFDAMINFGGRRVTSVAT